MTKQEKIKALPIRVSTGNTKLGEKVYNINLTPIVSCVEDVLCAKDCYAMKAYSQYPAVRKAWDMNLDCYDESASVYFRALFDYITLHPNMKLFRFHSAGEMPDERYWSGVRNIAGAFPEIAFLIFTKQYGFDYTWFPKNLSVIISTWPGMALPKLTGQPSAYNLPWAWIAHDPRAPTEHAFNCPGACGECSYECWKNRDRDVVFKLH